MFVSKILETKSILLADLCTTDEVKLVLHFPHY